MNTMYTYQRLCVVLLTRIHIQSIITTIIQYLVHIVCSTNDEKFPDISGTIVTVIVYLITFSLKFYILPEIADLKSFKARVHNARTRPATRKYICTVCVHVCMYSYRTHECEMQNLKYGVPYMVQSQLGTVKPLYTGQSHGICSSGMSSKTPPCLLIEFWTPCLGNTIGRCRVGKLCNHTL